MAPVFPVVIDKTLWITAYTLEFGTFTYGAVMLFATLWYMFWPDINWADWIYFLFAATPMASMFCVLLAKSPTIDGTKSASDYIIYARVNWYFSFFAWCIGTFQVIAQTVILAVLISKVGEGAIVFRGAGETLDQMVGGVTDEWTKTALRSIPTGLFTNL